MATTPKNFRMDDRFLSILANVAKSTGQTETQIMQACGSMYALQVGVEVNRARAYLYENLLAAVATTNKHRPHPQTLRRRKPRKA